MSKAKNQQLISLARAIHQNAKGLTVLVKCLSVDPDGFPVDKEGEPLGPRQRRIYFWEKRWRRISWLRDNQSLWKAVPKQESEERK